MLIGLTGGIGAGKSTVAAGFARRGAVVIDADAISKEVVEPDGPALAAIVERFGSQVLDPTGALDRASLAEIVFADPGARAELEGIIHPMVGEEIARRVEAEPRDALVVIDVPLLVETDARNYDRVVVVEAPTEIRLERLAARGLDRDGARARIAAQVSDEQWRTVADFIIDNGRDRSHLEREMDRVWADLRKAAASSASQ